MYQIPESQWAQVIDPSGPSMSIQLSPLIQRFTCCLIIPTVYDTKGCVSLDQDWANYSSTSSTPVFVDQTCIYGKVRRGVVYMFMVARLIFDRGLPHQGKGGPHR